MTVRAWNRVCKSWTRPARRHLGDVYIYTTDIARFLILGPAIIPFFRVQSTARRRGMHCFRYLPEIVFSHTGNWCASVHKAKWQFASIVCIQRCRGQFSELARFNCALPYFERLWISSNGVPSWGMRSPHMLWKYRLKACLHSTRYICTMIMPTCRHAHHKIVCDRFSSEAHGALAVRLTCPPIHNVPKTLIRNSHSHVLKLCQSTRSAMAEIRHIISRRDSEVLNACGRVTTRHRKPRKS